MSQPQFPVVRLPLAKEYLLTFTKATGTSKCEICHERSTWEFSRDFYFRAESANEYARKLERDLHELAREAQRSQQALTQCEASLIASWNQLNEERLEHRASREALALECARHKDTLDMLERVFQEARRSGEIADTLKNKVIELQATSSLGILTSVSIGAFLSKESSTPSETSTSANQQNGLARKLPETCAKTSDENHSGGVEKQHATQPANVDNPTPRLMTKKRTRFASPLDDVRLD